jgi:hypothetical protein
MRSGLVYNLEIKQTEKIFLATMSGVITEKESLEYIEEFEKKIKSINPFNYNIVVDSRELKTSQHSFGIVGKMMELITSTPFKHITVLC